MKLIIRLMGATLASIGLNILLYMGPESKYYMTNYLFIGGVSVYAGVMFIIKNQD